MPIGYSADEVADHSQKQHVSDRLTGGRDEQRKRRDATERGDEKRKNLKT